MKLVNITKILGMSVLALLMTGCGGGEGSERSNEDVPQKTMLQITDQNADQVIAAATQSMQGVMYLDDWLGGLGTVNGSMAANTTESGNESCSGGGTVSYSLSNTEGYFIFNHCVENDIGLTLDGKISMTMNGNDISAQYTNFRLELHNEDVTAYYKNASININLNNYDMDGITTGYINAKNEMVEFENYAFSKNGNKYTYNGLIKTNCISNWIELKTTQSLELSNYGSGCPISGEIEAIGNNSDFKTVFHSNQSVDVYLNGESYATYSDCNELPSSNGICN